MELVCEFIPKTRKTAVDEHYNCCVKSANITESTTVIKKFIGDHGEGKSDDDVNSTVFINSVVEYLPKSIVDIFPNLRKLSINDCSFKKISREDLKGFEKLAELSIMNCLLKSLPDDLFLDMKNLTAISFSGNMIESASSALLKPFEGRRMTMIDFRKNKRIDYCYYQMITNVGSVESLMELIDSQCKIPIFKYLPPPKQLQQEKETKFVGIIGDLWTSGRYSDLTIIAGSKKFAVHKSIVAMQSTVLAKIIDETSASELEIQEFSESSVEQLLCFLYTGDLQLNENTNVEDNLKIATKFGITEMQKFYEEVFLNHLNNDNKFQFFFHSCEFSSENLKRKAFEKIQQEFQDRLSDNFVDQPEEVKTLFQAKNLYERLLKKMSAK